MAISDFLLQNGWMFSLSPRPDCELKFKKKLKSCSSLFLIWWAKTILSLCKLILKRGPVLLNHILHLIIQSRTHLFAMETAESVAESCPPLALIAPCEVTDLMYFCLPS